MVVMAAARISLTGSARKTANTLLDKKSGRIKMRGISRISFRRHARSRTAQHRVVKKTQALNLVKRLLYPLFIIGTEVVTCDQLTSLADPLHRHCNKLADTGNDGHCSNCQVATVP